MAYYAYVNDTSEDFELSYSFRSSLENSYQLISNYITSDPQYIHSSIRPRRKTDTDLTLILLRGQGIAFLNPSDDPFFAVHRRWEYDNTTTLPEGWVRYGMDHDVNTLVCTEQYRFCSSITRDCVSWRGLLSGDPITSGSYPILFGPGKLDPKSAQATNYYLTSQLIEQFIYETPIHRSISLRGVAALQASRYLNYGDQIYLRPDQWQWELEFWFMMSLATMQLEIFNTIDIPVNLDPTRSTNAWATLADGIMLKACGKVKFRDPNHTSLSTFGLIMILVFSGALMVASGLAMGATGWENRWTQKWKFVGQWQRDEVLTLLENTSDRVSYWSGSLY